MITPLSGKRRWLHLSGSFVKGALIKLANAHPFCLFRDFCGKVNSDVHFDPYFVIFPIWSEILYQTDTSF